MIAWPGGLPFKMEGLTHSRSYPRLFARTEFESGKPRRRRVARSRPWRGNMVLFFSKAEVETFETYVDTDLQGGAVGFIAPACAGLLAGKTCFIMPQERVLFEARQIAADTFQIALEVEALA